MKTNIIGISQRADKQGVDNVIPLFPESSESAKSISSLRSKHGNSESGMATAEYAIATLAAVGFAGILVAILRSDEVRGFLLAIIRNALNLG